MKWIYAKDNVFYPPTETEVLAVFDSAPETVWNAQLFDDGKWYESAVSGELEHELHGQLICWRPWPQSPFRFDVK